MDPLAIIPAEAWLYVINKLNVTDKHAAYNTCQLWRGLLQKSQTVWMFEDIFPLLIKYLSNSAILEARLVCKGWKRIIDSYLENNQPTIVAPGKHPLFTHILPIRTLGVCFGKTAQRLGLSPLQALQRFHFQFETEQVPTCNPFVSRSLHFEVNFPQVNLIMAVEKFFEKFGVHLFSLHLCIRQRVHVPQENVTQLRIVTFVFNILACVPNLRKLDFKFEEHHRNECFLCEIKTPEACLFLNENAAPPLPHLTNLQLDVPSLMGEALESAYAPQLEVYAHVRVGHQRPDSTNLNNITKTGWHFTRGCPIKHLKRLEYRKDSIPLRLHVKMRKLKGLLWHDLLYKTVERFQDNLTHLSINSNKFDAYLPRQLDLPFLQKLFLEIRCWRNISSFDLSFLQTLTSINKVKFAFVKLGFERLLEFYKNREKSKYQPMRESVDLHYHLYDNSHGGPYKSNVWQFVPSLDRIEIQVVSAEYQHTITLYKVYTRGHKDKKV